MTAKLKSGLVQIISIAVLFLALIPVAYAGFDDMVGFLGGWRYLVVNAFIAFAVLFIVQAILMQGKGDKEKTVVWIFLIVISIAIGWYFGSTVGYIWQHPFIGKIFSIHVIVNAAIIGIIAYLIMPWLKVNMDSQPGKIGLGIIVGIIGLVAAIKIGPHFIWELETVKMAIDFAFGEKGILTFNESRIIIFTVMTVLLIFLFNFLKVSEDNKTITTLLALVIAAGLARQGMTIDALVRIAQIILIITLGTKLKDVWGGSNEHKMMTVLAYGTIAALIFYATSLIAPGYGWFGDEKTGKIAAWIGLAGGLLGILGSLLKLGFITGIIFIILRWVRDKWKNKGTKKNSEHDQESPEGGTDETGKTPPPENAPKDTEKTENENTDQTKKESEEKTDDTTEKPEPPKSHKLNFLVNDATLGEIENAQYTDAQSNPPVAIQQTPAEIPQGSTVHLEAKETNGIFEKWEVKKGTVPADKHTAKILEFTLSDDVEVIAHFNKQNFILSLSVNEPTLGTIAYGFPTQSPAPTQLTRIPQSPTSIEIPSGRVVHIVALPSSPASEFLKWETPNMQLPNPPEPRLELTIENDFTLTANFGLAAPPKTKININVEPKKGGTVEVQHKKNQSKFADLSGSEVDIGDRIKIIATANKGYVIENWEILPRNSFEKLDAKEQNKDNPNGNIKFTVKGDVTVNVTFKKSKK